jgi:S1-C subfamily serine protease
VIAVAVRLESDAQVSDTDEAPSQSRPYTENSPFYRYFFGNPEQQSHPPAAGQIKTALGSGFFISSDGYAVTRWLSPDPPLASP